MKQTPEKHKRLLFYILINSLVHKSSSLNMEKVYSSCNVIFNTSWLTDRVLFDQTSHVMKLHVFTEPSSCLNHYDSHWVMLMTYHHHGSHWVMFMPTSTMLHIESAGAWVLRWPWNPLCNLLLPQLSMLLYFFISCTCYVFASSVVSVITLLLHPLSLLCHSAPG